jgi:hypothetical protein
MHNSSKIMLMPIQNELHCFRKKIVTLAGGSPTTMMERVFFSISLSTCCLQEHVFFAVSLLTCCLEDLYFSKKIIAYIYVPLELSCLARLPLALLISPKRRRLPLFNFSQNDPTSLNSRIPDIQCSDTRWINYIGRNAVKTE